VKAGRPTLALKYGFPFFGKAENKKGTKALWRMLWP